jgi:hypothetical protein
MCLEEATGQRDELARINTFHIRGVKLRTTRTPAFHTQRPGTRSALFNVNKHSWAAGFCGMLPHIRRRRSGLGHARTAIFEE